MYWVDHTNPPYQTCKPYTGTAKVNGGITPLEYFSIFHFESILIECIHFSAFALARSVYLGTAAGSCCLVALAKEH